MNGINFGMEGPQVNGWWYNPKTGDRFNALDTYFEDNNLLIKTADGRLLNYNQIQNYVHVEDPKSIPSKPSATASTTDDVPPEVLAEIEGDKDPGDGLLIPDDNIYGRPTKQQPGELGNIYNGPEPQSPSPAVQDFAIIDRALSGKDNPVVTGDIEWKGFPKREIEMLVEVMQIPEQEIIQYYINSISLDSLRDMVSQSIERYIKDKLGLGVDTQEQNEISEKTHVETTKDETPAPDFTPIPAPLKTKKKTPKLQK